MSFRGALILLTLWLCGCVRLLGRADQRDGPPSAYDDRHTPNDRSELERPPSMDLPVDADRGEKKTGTDRTTDPDRNPPFDQGKKSDNAADLYWVSDAQLATCSNFASWTCGPGKYGSGCSLECLPFTIVCYEVYPQTSDWGCECLVARAFSKLIPASATQNCSGCRKYIPDCWPGLAP